jgi:CDP-ribitol ribitolphosphotransferase
MEAKEIIFEVSKLSWERVFLNLEITTNYTGEAEFHLESLGRVLRDEDNKIVDVKIKKVVPLSYETKEGSVYSFVCNIAALDGRQFLDNGRWRIVASTKDGDFTCFTSHEVAYHFDDYSRIYRYGGGKYAYNVSFSSLTEDERYLWFFINS